MELMRSLLFVPGNRVNMIEKAWSLSPDVIVLDLEDSVPAGEKENARLTIKKVLSELPENIPPVFVRVNSWYTQFIIPDLDAVICAGLAGVVVPKTDDAIDLVKTDAIVQAFEQLRGLERDKIKLMGSVESASAISNVKDLATASPRIIALTIGLDDFVTDLGIPRSEDGVELLYPRIQLALACIAAGIDALDGVFVDYKNEAGLIKETNLVRQIGFKGKFVIHPDQIGAVNRSFTASDKEMDLAGEVVKTFEEALARGSAATSLRGKMIDTPVAERARKIIRQAEAIKIIEEKRRKYGR